MRRRRVNSSRRRKTKSFPRAPSSSCCGTKENSPRARRRRPTERFCFRISAIASCATIPQSGKTTVFRDPSGKSNGLKFDPAGQLVACEGAAPGGNRRISITDSQGNVRTLADRFEGKRFNSPNDLAITTAGRVYFTDPRYVGDEPRELDFEGGVPGRARRRRATWPRATCKSPTASSSRPTTRRSTWPTTTTCRRQPSALGIRRASRRHAGRQARALRFRTRPPRHRRHDARSTGQYLCHRRQRPGGRHLCIRARGPAAGVHRHARRSEQLRVRHRQRSQHAVHHRRRPQPDRRRLQSGPMRCIALRLAIAGLSRLPAGNRE